MTEPKSVAIHHSLSASFHHSGRFWNYPMPNVRKTLHVTCVTNVQSTNGNPLHRVSCRLAPLQPGHPPVFCERFQAWPSVHGITIPRSWHGHHTPVHGATSLQPAGTAFYQHEPILATSGFSTKTTINLKSNEAPCCLFQMVAIFSHPGFASKDWNVVDQAATRIQHDSTINSLAQVS